MLTNEIINKQKKNITVDKIKSEIKLIQDCLFLDFYDLP